MAEVTAFFDAIKAGELDQVKALVSANPELVNAHAASGESAVLTSVYHGQKAITNLLVARGATLTLADASAAGEIERVERLISEAPSEVNGYSADGWTPLHLAAFFGHLKVAELLLANGADVAKRSTNALGNTPLHAALAANRQMLVGLLVGKGADVNAADASGWRPLHLAAANNNLDALNALVAHGADVQATNRDGQTPLDLAHEKKHRELAAALQRYGA